MLIFTTMFSSVSKAVPLGLALVLCVALSGCGPREVGDDTSSAYYNDSAREPSSDVGDSARYPMDGSASVQRRLYLLNQPAVQERALQQQRDYLNHRLGITREEQAAQDARQQPRQRSPFRDF